MEQVLNSKGFRIIALLLHISLNFLIVSFLTTYDISGSWIGFLLFLVACIFLLVLFVMHLIAFIRFIQSK